MTRSRMAVVTGEVNDDAMSHCRVEWRARRNAPKIPDGYLTALDRRCLTGEAFAETSVATFTSSAATAGTAAESMIVVAATAANVREILFILPPLGST